MLKTIITLGELGCILRATFENHSNAVAWSLENPFFPSKSVNLEITLYEEEDNSRNSCPIDNFRIFASGGGFCHVVLGIDLPGARFTNC
jgi:hypothetical protein